MNTRDFLKLLGAMLFGYGEGARAAEAHAMPMAQGRKRVVVIGAGLAGLAAARELHRQGHEVVVVEARDRIGGRIWTSTHWPDMPLDLGASWIHGVRGNPLTGLADKIQARRLSTRYDRAMTYNTLGKPLSVAEERRMDHLRTQLFKALEKAQARDTDTTVRQVLASLMRQFDESSEAHRFLSFILNSEIEQEYSGSATKLSAHAFDSAQEFDGGDVLFAQGFRVITEFLADTLPIELGQVVREIQWDTSPIRVLTDTTEYFADHVVVTLPLGVLKAKPALFAPQLPKVKQDAISKLGMGVLNKCYLRFQEAFWPADVDWLQYVSAKHGEWTEWVSFKRAANIPVLLGFNAADGGLAIEAWPDQQVVASAMQTLRTMFGQGIPEPVDYQITRWAADPFALGSYSYNAVGVTGATREALAAPLKQRLFFAGEASESDYYGTAHGAYLSGLRAAREVLASP